jgi:hypothetical protein
MQAAISNENLPRSMRYGLSSANAVQSETTLSRFSAVNGNVFAPTSSNEIRIKIRGNGFLQTNKHYLHFQVTNTSADTNGQVDLHAGSFFDRIRIESNGQVVEEINSYGVYNAIRQYYNNDVNELYKKVGGSGASGLAVKFTPSQIGLADDNTAAAVKAVTDAAFTADSGRLFEVERSSVGEYIAFTDIKHFVIQIESGLLLNTHGKALPDGLNELDLILRLAPNKQAMVAGGATGATYSITNPTLYCPTMKILNGDVMASYRQVVAQEGVLISGVTAKTYINSVALAAGTKSLQINDRSISCLGLVTALRVAIADSSNTAYSNSAFGYTDVEGTDKCTSYHYQIAGSNWPQSNVNISIKDDGLNIGRAIEESCKALAPMGHDYCKSMASKTKTVSSFANAYAASPGTNGINIPCALFSVDLKRMSDDGLRMCGLNTAQNSSPSTLEIEVTAALAADCTATTFAIAEIFFQMAPDGSLSSAM